MESSPPLRELPPAILLVTFEQLASVLEQMGCPKEKSLEMAAQLDKRARQLAEQKGRSYEDALAHLLELMRQGWSAQQRDLR